MAIEPDLIQTREEVEQEAFDTLHAVLHKTTDTLIRAAFLGTLGDFVSHQAGGAQAENEGDKIVSRGIARRYRLR